MRSARISFECGATRADDVLARAKHLAGCEKFRGRRIQFRPKTASATACIHRECWYKVCSRRL
jgi:hypothetical protein